jgi:hypothetical protein
MIRERRYRLGLDIDYHIGVIEYSNIHHNRREVRYFPPLLISNSVLETEIGHSAFLRNPR